MDLDTLVARAEIADVLARYVHAADRGEWTMVRACYHDDAYDDHGHYKGGPDELVAHLELVAAQFEFTSHQLGQQSFELAEAGDRAKAETYCQAWYGRRSRTTGGQWSIAQGLRYLDEFARRDGRWAIASRRVVMDWEHILPVTRPAQLEGWLRGSRGATDPSASFLAAHVQGR